MRIYYKDPKAFELLVIMNGYTHSALSKKIGKSRPYLNKSLSRGIIGADAAKKLIEVLDGDFDEIFEGRED
jgi:hypothetical protein